MLAAALIACAALGLAVGTPTLDAGALWAGATGAAPRLGLLLWDYRVPRVLYTLTVGASLAVGGALLQAAFRNDLAEPGILGIPAGGASGALLGLMFGAGLAARVPAYLPLCAFAGAGAVAVLVDRVARRAGPEAVLLVGVVVTTALTSTNLALATVGPRFHYDLVYGWLAGSMGLASWRHLAVLAPLAAALLLAAQSRAAHLDVLALGDAAAGALGMRVRATRRTALALACGLAAACVAVGGSVVFLGLLAPHIARRVVGVRHRALLPAAAATGGSLLLAADVLGRWVMPAAPLPAGVVVALSGGPLFLFLLARTGRPTGGAAPSSGRRRPPDRRRARSAHGA